MSIAGTWIACGVVVVLLFWLEARSAPPQKRMFAAGKLDPRSPEASRRRDLRFLTETGDPWAPLRAEIAALPTYNAARRDA